MTLPAAFDVTSASSVDAGVARIEVGVGNAGHPRQQRRYAAPGPGLDFSVADWEELVATNLTSAFLVSQRVGRGMVDRGSGKIVMIGSVQEPAGESGHRALLRDQGRRRHADPWALRGPRPEGHPGERAVPRLHRHRADPGAGRRPGVQPLGPGRTPAGRWGGVEDLVGALVFLASAASDFVNGQVLYVDGGMTAVV